MAISILIPIVMILLIVVVGVGVAVGTKNQIQKKGGEEQMIRNVYVYLVLFATLMMSIGGSVAAFMAVADIVAPTPYYQSFEDFKRWGTEKPYSEKEVNTEEKVSEEELKERYDAMVLAENQKQIERAKNSLIKSFGWIIIPLGIFIYFQRNLVRSKA